MNRDKFSTWIWQYLNKRKLLRNNWWTFFHIHNIHPEKTFIDEIECNPTQLNTIEQLNEMHATQYN